MRIWQPPIGRMVRIIRQPADVLCLAWSQDGSHLVTGAKDGHLQVLERDRDVLVVDQSRSRDRITALIVTPDGSVLLAGDSGGKIHSVDAKALGPPRKVR